MSPLSNATTLANYASGIGTQGATLEIQTANKRVGIGTTNPQGPAGSLQVGTAVTISGNSGIVSATTFHGDFGSSTSVAGNLSVSGVLTYEDVTNIDSVGIITARKNIVLPDSSDSSDGRIKFGASSDMMLYHYGGANYIDVTNTLNIRGGGGSAINIKPKNDEEGIKIIPNGAIELYYDNSKKLETTSGGVSVTGTLNASTRINVNNSTTTASDIVHSINTGGSLATVQRTKADGTIQLGSVNGGADTANIVLNANGTGTFTSRVNVGANDLDNRAVVGYNDSNSAGSITANNYTSTGPVWQAYNASVNTSTATSTIFADGSVTFAGTIDVNSNSLLQDGARIVPNGVIQVRKDAAGLNRCIEVYKGGNALSNITANINNDGSATFAGDVTFGGNLELGDNNRIRLGAGDDLQIYHNGSDSYIHDAGTGDLIILANNLRIANTSGTNYITGISGGATELKFGGNTKLATSSAGVSITGSGTFTSQVSTSDRFDANRTGSSDNVFNGRLNNTLTSSILANGAATFGPLNISSSTGYGAQVDMAANAATVKAQCQQTASALTLLFAGYMGTNKNFHVTAGGAAEFTGYVTSNEGFYVSQTAAPSAASIFKSWYGATTYVDILDNGSATFNGTSLFKIQPDATVAAGVHNGSGFVSQLNHNGSATFGGDVICANSKIDLVTSSNHGEIRVRNSGGSLTSYISGSTGTGYFAGQLFVNITSAIASGQVSVLFNGTAANGITLQTTRAQNNSTFAVFVRSDGTTIGYITQNAASSTFYATSSDYRLKENVTAIPDGINRVKQLKPCRFNFIDDSTQTVDGFLAHEAQTVVPEAVTGTKDEVDDDGKAVMQGIDQAKLVPLLTAALQEAIAKIETLETKVAALEG